MINLNFPTMPVEIVGLPIVTFLLLGMIIGLSQCVWKALPFLVPLLVDGDLLIESPTNKYRRAITFFVPSMVFSIGRIVIYTFYAVLVILIGRSFLSIFFISDQYILLQGIAYATGAVISFLYVFKRISHTASKKCEEECSKLPQPQKQNYQGTFSMGILSGAVPCFPMLFVLSISFVASLTYSNPLVAVLIPISFGVGSTIPILIGSVAVATGSSYGTSFMGPDTLRKAQIVGSGMTLFVGLFMLQNLWLLVVG